MDGHLLFLPAFLAAVEIGRLHQEHVADSLHEFGHAHRPEEAEGRPEHADSVADEMGFVALGQKVE